MQSPRIACTSQVRTPVIFFDIDGTLIDHASASAVASLALHDEFSGEIPFPRDEFPAAWERIMDRHFRALLPGRDFIVGPAARANSRVVRRSRVDRHRG